MVTLEDTQTEIDHQEKDHSILHHSLVTNDSEVLKFSAAAALQIAPRLGFKVPWDLDHRLITSPYNDHPHLLDLARLDIQSRLLAEALTVLKPIREDYALAEYTESFNWKTVIETLQDLSAARDHCWTEQTFHVVTFRSRLRAGVDNSYLQDLDAHSHQEATKSGGLLKYWFGSKDAKLRNLATCKFTHCATVDVTYAKGL